MDKNLKFISDAPDEIKRIMKEVLRIEREKLSELKPKGIKEDIIEIIKKEIQ